jgi:hypothetical protein
LSVFGFGVPVVMVCLLFVLLRPAALQAKNWELRFSADATFPKAANFRWFPAKFASCGFFKLGRRLVNRIVGWTLYADHVAVEIMVV